MRSNVRRQLATMSARSYGVRRSTPKRKKIITKNKKNKNSDGMSFELNVKKCWKEMNINDITLSDDGLNIMNSFVMHMFDKIVKQCFILVKYNFAKTCMARDVQNAVGLCIKGELKKHCMNEGTMAVNKQFDSLKTGNNKGSRIRNIFPVGKIAKYMKLNCMTLRISAGSPVYLGAVLQYLTQELLMISCKNARNNSKNVISSREIYLGIENDYDLKELIGKTWIKQSGTIPDIICYINDNNNDITNNITNNNQR